MAMNTEGSSLEENDVTETEELPKLAAGPATPWKYTIIYPNVVTFSYGHLAALYGLYLFFTSAQSATIRFNMFLAFVSGFGITAGAHRLWTHRAYKAKMPLQILLMVLNSIAFQNSAINWIRDHRLHHRYCDTDADPHNATRGFFYSHVGWLLVKKHPEVIRRGKLLDMSDIYSNPVLTFQKKYAIPLFGSFCFLFPTIIPVYFWGETLSNAWHVNLLRYIFTLNVTFMVNSVAHMFGSKPYDKSISPVQSLITSFLVIGEGFHNYHHVYPWDYRTAELGNNWLNLTTLFIDFFEWVGWAYDVKVAPEKVVKARAARTGDGTNKWGWSNKIYDDEKHISSDYTTEKIR